MADPGFGKSRVTPPLSRNYPMRACINLRNLLLTVIIAASLNACAPTKPAGPLFFYLNSELTYLRDKPAYDGNVVAQLYKGDKVERLDLTEVDWWQVRSGRTGQVGWIQGELLSPTPVPIAYFITQRTVPLRECAGEDCPSLQLLFKGDQVQKVGENDQGWWRVLLEKGRILGWLPASALSDRPDERLAGTPEKAPKKVYYYVAVLRLKLRTGPQMQAEAVKDLKFNDQLEKLEQNSQGWMKVRHPMSRMEGWVAVRYLATLPSESPRRLRPAKKPALKPPQEKDIALPELEIM